MTPRAIWHFGRFGDVPGGMTQVLNAYQSCKSWRSPLHLVATRSGRNIYQDLLLSFRAARCIRGLDSPEHILVFHLSQGGSFVREGLLLRYARRRGLPAIAHIHGSRFEDFAHSHSRLCRLILSVSSGIIVLNDGAKSCSMHVAPGVESVVVPNAVPLGDISQPKEAVVVFGGLVSRRKGVDTLLRAWEGVEDRAGWKLLLAGPIGDSDVLRSVSGVEVLGAVPHSDLMEILDRAAIAVLPSRDEGMPMFILEALARRNLVISTDVGGIPTLLRDGAGVIVSPSDASALQVALARAIHDPEWRYEIATRGHHRMAGQFAASVVYPQLEKVWTRLAFQAEEV